MCSKMAAPKEQIDRITKSPLDTRDYRYLLLQNDMKILLISDKDTDKAAAAMSVHVGYMSDPDAIPGLAHLCEHMLFLGTEKYPAENEYREFVISHGGFANAYTCADSTNYHFDLAHDHLKGALDRFAQFFLCPLFNADMTDREVKAVESENEKNIQNDHWRLNQIRKSTSKPGHPYKKFGTGNKQTLEINPRQNGIDVRKELLKFHSTHYSSNLMCLTVLGREALDELGMIVLELFNGVANNSVPLPFYPDHPYGKDELQLCVQYCPVKDLRQIVIIFPLPDLTEHYKSKPSHYCAHLIGHEAPGSIFSLLKAKSWSTALGAGPSIGAKGFWFFVINLTLTEEGQDHVDDIVTIVFQYIAMLRTCGIQKWIFSECADLADMEFRFKDKSEPRSCVTSLSKNLHSYPVEDILSFQYVMAEFDERLYKTYLDWLQPCNMRLTVINKKFEGKTDTIEPWYGSNYSIVKLDPALLKKWEDVAISDALHLPARNDFIPTNFDLHPLPDNPPKRPQKIKDTDMSRVWFKQDDTFLTPKAHVYIAFENPATFRDPSTVMMTKLFVMLLDDELNEFTYNATIAGISYSLESTKRGIAVKIKGFNEKQSVLLAAIVTRLVGFIVDDKKFDVYKELLTRSLKNFQLEEPYKQALFYTGLLCAEKGWTKEQLAEALQLVTPAMLQSFKELFLSQLHLESLLHGNMTPELALQLVADVEALVVDTRPLLPSQQLLLREVKLPASSCYSYTSTNAVHSSCCVGAYYQIGMQSFRDNAILELFVQIVKEPCFNVLRTKEQLGYIVAAMTVYSRGTEGMLVLIQSEKDVHFVDGRIENFLDSLSSILASITEDALLVHVKALEVRKLEKPKKLSAENSKYVLEIDSHQYEFDRDEVEVGHLKTLTKDDVINFYHKQLAVNAPEKSKLSIHIVPEASKGDDVTDAAEEGVVAADKPHPIHDIATFRSELGLYPLPVPNI